MQMKETSDKTAKKDSEKEQKISKKKTDNKDSWMRKLRETAQKYSLKTIEKDSGKWQRKRTAEKVGRKVRTTAGKWGQKKIVKTVETTADSWEKQLKETSGKKQLAHLPSLFCIRLLYDSVQVGELGLQLLQQGPGHNNRHQPLCRRPRR